MPRDYHYYNTQGQILQIHLITKTIFNQDVARNYGIESCCHTTSKQDQIKLLFLLRIKVKYNLLGNQDWKKRRLYLKMIVFLFTGTGLQMTAL